MRQAILVPSEDVTQDTFDADPVRGLPDTPCHYQPQPRQLPVAALEVHSQVSRAKAGSAFENLPELVGSLQSLYRTKSFIHSSRILEIRATSHSACSLLCALPRALPPPLAPSGTRSREARWHSPPGKWSTNLQFFVIQAGRALPLGTGRGKGRGAEGRYRLFSEEYFFHRQSTIDHRKFLPS